MEWVLQFTIRFKSKGANEMAEPINGIKAIDNSFRNDMAIIDAEGYESDNSNKGIKSMFLFD